MMSSRPNSLIAVSTIAATSASFVTSVCVATADPPADLIFSTTAMALSWLISATTTEALSRDIAHAVAAPIPLPAPVTMATLSFKRSVTTMVPSWGELLSRRGRAESAERIQLVRQPAEVGLYLVGGLVGHRVDHFGHSEVGPP